MLPSQGLPCSSDHCLHNQIQGQSLALANLSICLHWLTLAQFAWVTFCLHGLSYFETMGRVKLFNCGNIFTNTMSSSPKCYCHQTQKSLDFDKAELPAQTNQEVLRMQGWMRCHCCLPASARSAPHQRRY